MSIKLPDDLVPWPDMEVVITDLLLDVADLCEPKPWVGTWIPDDYEAMVKSAPLIVVQRTTGAALIEHQTDNPLIEVGVVASSRADAQKLINYLRVWMVEKLPVYPSLRLRIISVDERLGAVMPPWVNPEQRYVKALFEIAVRKPRR